jgi:hypothetical protein
VIRCGVVGRLEIGLSDPVVDRSPAAADTQPFEMLFNIRK